MYNNVSAHDDFENQVREEQQRCLQLQFLSGGETGVGGLQMLRQSQAVELALFQIFIILSPLGSPFQARQSRIVWSLVATFQPHFPYHSPSQAFSLWQISISNALLNNSNFLISKHPSLKGNTPLPPHQGKCGKKVGEWCPRECQIQCGAWERIKMNMKFCQVHAFCSV